MPPNSFLNSFFLGLLVLGLTACGGGGGGFSTDAGSGSDGQAGLSYAASVGATIFKGDSFSVIPSTGRGFSSCAIKSGSANSSLFASLALRIDSGTCEIQGQPADLLLPATFTVQALDSTGVIREADVTLAVEPRPNQVVYVANTAKDTVSVYSVDPARGTLRLVNYASTGSGCAPKAIVADPTARFAYVACSGNDKIRFFTISPVDGALVYQSDTSTYTGPQNLALDPTGHFLFVLHGGSSQLSVYGISSSGTLTATDVQSLSGAPEGLTVDPSGRFVYASTNTDIEGFSVDAAGTLSPLSLAENYPSSALHFDPSGRHLYALSDNSGQGGVYTLNRATGAIGSASSFATASLFTSAALSFERSGHFMYAPNATSNGVDIYSLNAGSGVPTALRTQIVESGCAPKSLTTDFSGRFLFVTCTNTAARTYAYEVNADDGSLTAQGSLGNVAASPAGITSVLLSARFLYAANQTAGSITTYSIHAADGTLESAAPAQTGGLATPKDLAVDPRGEYLYALNSGDDSIQAFRVDAGSGQLEAVGSPLSVGAGGNSLRLDAGGRFAYLIRSAGTLEVYARDATSGALSFASSASAGTSPVDLVFHPTGLYAYVANQGDGTISMFSVNTGTGALTAFSAPATVSTGGAPTRLQIDPTGLYLYASLGSGNSVASFAIDPSTGRLTATTQATFSLGNTSEGLAVDPTGRQVYASSGGAQSLAWLALDRDAGGADPGALSSVTSTATTAAAACLIADPAGRFLFSALPGASAEVGSYSVNHDTSTLGAESHLSTDAGPTALVLVP